MSQADKSYVFFLRFSCKGIYTCHCATQMLHLRDCQPLLGSLSFSMRYKVWTFCTWKPRQTSRGKWQDICERKVNISWKSIEFNSKLMGLPVLQMSFLAADCRQIVDFGRVKSGIGTFGILWIPQLQEKQPGDWIKSAENDWKWMSKLMTSELSGDVTKCDQHDLAFAPTLHISPPKSNRNQGDWDPKIGQAWWVDRQLFSSSILTEYLMVDQTCSNMLKHPDGFELLRFLWRLFFLFRTYGPQPPPFLKFLRLARYEWILNSPTTLVLKFFG